MLLKILGYLLIDAEDYGIYEFKSNLKLQKDCIRTVINDNKILKYNIFNEAVFIKYAKNTDLKYVLITYQFTSVMAAQNGDFKDSKISHNYRIEPTSNFDTSRLKEIDFVTLKFAK